MNIGELVITLGVDADGLTVASTEFKRFEKDVEKSMEKTEKAVEGVGEGIGGLGKAAIELTPVIAVATAVLGIMVDWLKATELGADLTTKSTSLLGEAIDALMYNRKADFKEAKEIADEENRLRQQQRHDMVRQAAMGKDIRKGRLEIYDVDKSISERLALTNDLIAQQKTLESSIVSGKKEELAVVERKLKLDPINTKLLDQEAKLMAEILGIQEESLQLTRMKNNLQKQQEAYMKALEDAFTPDTNEILKQYNYQLQDTNTYSKLLGNTYDKNEALLSIYNSTLRKLIESGIDPADEAVVKLAASIRQLEGIASKQKWMEDMKKDLEDFARAVVKMPESFAAAYSPKAAIQGGGMARGGKDLAGGPTVESIKNMNTALESTQRIVDMVEKSFYDLFTNLGGGFKGMVDSMINSFKLLAAQLAAKAAIFGILTLLSGGTSKLAGFALDKLVAGGGTFKKFMGFAEGTNSAPGGLSLVGEKGPELVNLPRGSQVFPNDLLGAALGRNEGGQVRFVIEENQLVGILKKASKRKAIY